MALVGKDLSENQLKAAGEKQCTYLQYILPSHITISRLYAHGSETVTVCRNLFPFFAQTVNNGIFVHANC